MKINLNAPLAWTNANVDEIKMLQSLQGNILKGHGREHTANIFFTLDPTKAAASKRMLRNLANFHVTSAYQQLLDTKAFKKGKRGGGAFVHVALSFKGYQALGLAASAPTDSDFTNGMKSATSLTALADPALAKWEAPFQKDLHGIVLAAHVTEGHCAALAASIEEMIGDAGGEIQHVQHGRALKNAADEGIEHFGYVDGRSQPLMLVEDIKEENKTAGTAQWDPAFPLSAALVQDPGVPVANPVDATSFGSFFVFRKLEQAVRDFKSQEQVVADLLGLTEGARELAGARIVGRFEDGTPVTMSDTAKGLKPPNDFNYDADPAARCPFHAHIRKVNPRGAGGAEPHPKERLHIMPRRGIPFEDKKRVTHPNQLPDSGNMKEFKAKVAPHLPTGGVGLLFMAYNQNIGRQFKFTQQTWANNNGFPLPGTHGIDPVIGQAPGNPVPPGNMKMHKIWDDTASQPVNTPFAGFVTMKGGEYFFSPSVAFLKAL